MLKQSELKNWLHKKGLRQVDKLLLVLASFEAPVQVRDIKVRAKEGGLKIAKGWNPSSSLGKSDGLAINTSDGWELSESGKAHLRALGITQFSPAAEDVAHDLRDELAKIKDENTRLFVGEAVKCFELKLYRSAVIMSWVGAVSLLQDHIVKNYLSAFNAEARRIDAKWKTAKTTDDLSRMKESDFLDRLVSLSVFGKNVKDELAICLKLRNGCGHPNDLKIGQNRVAHHIEILLLNVFQKY